MLEGARRCQEFGYNPAYWLRMISEYGGVGAAKRLLRGSRASDGFTRLWEEGRLDLSVELYMLLPKYRELFTDDERAEARRRLELYEFDVDRGLADYTSPAPPIDPDSSRPIPSAPGPDGPEAPVVAAVIHPGAPDLGIWPTADDLARARDLFRAHERRDVFYRAATYLVAQALGGVLR